MTQLKISSFGPARHLIEQAGVVLIYLGIVAAFSVVSFIACVIWLMIW